MTTQEVLAPKSWAERTFGGVQLQDMRRTRRAVQAAINLAENPLGSLPAQMHTWKETKALSRLLDEPDVTFAVLMQPHLQQIREQAKKGSPSSPVQYELIRSSLFRYPLPEQIKVFQHAVDEIFAQKMMESPKKGSSSH